MLDAGVAHVHHTGTTMDEIVNCVRDSVHSYPPASTLEHATARLARAISIVHEGGSSDEPRRRPKKVVGITGAPGAGKSTLVAAMASEAVRRGERIAVVAFDPMSPITSGALL